MHVTAAPLGDDRGTAEAASLNRRARAVDRRGRRGGRTRHCCAADAFQHAEGGEPLEQKRANHLRRRPCGAVRGARKVREGAREGGEARCEMGRDVHGFR
eukprot:scaffold2475_cov66-Phaeocystis_antarctica.AAC.1